MTALNKDNVPSLKEGIDAARGIRMMFSRTGAINIPLLLLSELLKLSLKKQNYMVEYRGHYWYEIPHDLSSLSKCFFLDFCKYHDKIDKVNLIILIHLFQGLLFPPPLNSKEDGYT